VTAGAKKADGSAAENSKEYDPCLSPSTGARDIGVSQVGNLKVIASNATPAFSTPDSGEGDIVEGTFTISSNAVVGLRRFTMTNGDAAVFSNYFSISQAPTFTRLTYTSGTNRIVADTVSAIRSGNLTLAQDPNANFNVEGKLPRGATRRVLISGTGFVRGSFASMADPLISGSKAARPQGTSAGTTAPCTGLFGSDATSVGTNGSCFGGRSSSSLVQAAYGATTTPKITFSNAGVSVNQSLTTVVRDNGTDLSMATDAGQSTHIEDPFIATNRLSAVVTIQDNAPAGPVTMTVVNPDGGTIVIPNAFIVDGVPTLDVARTGIISLNDSSIVTSSDAKIKQGQNKSGATDAIYIYGSGFFKGGSGDLRQPQVLINGTGVRVTGVEVGNRNATSPNGDNNQYDTVLRVDLAVESTAPIGKRFITVILPDGQSITGDVNGNGVADAGDVTLEVTAP